MEEQGWDLGEDDEELFEYAMHPQQYEAYKSGKAKADFEKDLVPCDNKQSLDLKVCIFRFAAVAYLHPFI